MDILYLDSWFALNLLCDYLLCLLTARCAGLYLKRRRYALAALLGALFACAAYLPGLSALALPGSKLLCGGAMGGIAFGVERRPWRCLLLFFALSAAFGGALTLLSGPGPVYFSFRTFALAFLVCYGVGALLFRCQSVLREQEPVPVTVEHCGRAARFRALRDTGNRLRDPVTGAGILVASPRALRDIFRQEIPLLEALDPVALLELSCQIPELDGRLRLLPFSAVGRDSGLLPVFRPDRLLVDGRERRDLLIAIAPQAGGDGFEAIL